MSIQETVFLVIISVLLSPLHGCSETSKISISNHKSQDKISESQVTNVDELLDLKNDNNFNPPALSGKQAQELLNVKLKSPNTGRKLEAVIVPSYVPPNYEVEHFKTSSFLKNTDYLYEYYGIVYKDKSRNSCFLISASALDEDALGSSPIEVETIEKVRAEDLEIEVELGFIEFDRSTNSSLSISALGGQGEFSGSTYVFASPSEDFCDYGVSSVDAAKIIASMKYLNRSKSGKLQYSTGVTTSF